MAVQFEERLAGLPDVKDADDRRVLREGSEEVGVVRGSGDS